MHLSLKYLRRIKAKNPDMFLEDLKLVPSGLKEAYTKLYDSLLQGQSHEKVTIIQSVDLVLAYMRMQP